MSANAIFQNVAGAKQGRNRFDFSHEHKSTGSMGYIYPMMNLEVVPGDYFNVKTQHLIRFSPLLAPMYHNINVKMEYFFVPYRLVWDEWKDFITGGEDGTDLPSFPRQQVDGGFRTAHFQQGSLSDHLGLPIYNPSSPTAWATIGSTTGTRVEVSMLYHRAYQLIWNEWYRDQNLINDLEVPTGSGVLSGTGTEQTLLNTIRRSAWEKDYFTSALPFLQRGAEVTLPLGTTADLIFDNTSQLSGTKAQRSNTTTDATGVLTVSSGEILDSTSSSTTLDVTQSHTVDLTTATAATINELRKASALQRWLETMARAGSRYREQLEAMFDERIPDYTVQVPQYLGGGKAPLMISEVLSTYQDPSTGDRPQGDMTGKAMSTGDGIGFSGKFQEHGVILGLVRVIPKATYTQGISRFFQKFDKFDHYFPHFANLGEQEIKSDELYVTGDTSNNRVFGYQQRYAEYKYKENSIAGQFNTSLAFWELSRRFGSTPLLNESFIECNPDDRIFAITDPTEDKLWMLFYHDVDCSRKIPYHSNPSLT